MTFEDLLPATSSPESAGGMKPSGSPAGQLTDQSGPEVARASRTARRAKVSETPTPATSGPSSSASSASVALTRCLVSRLKERFARVGSIEFKQTWREKVTPSGIVYSAHTASGHRTSANDSTGSDQLGQWPTPTVPNGGRTGLRTEPGREGTPRHLSDAVTLVVSTLAGWNTPRATDGEKGGPNQSGGALPADAALAGWKTPMANEKVRSEEFVEGRASLSPMEALAGWATPTAQDHSRGTLPPRPQDTGVPLSQMAGLAVLSSASPRATPTTRDHKDGACHDANVPVNALLGRQAVLASGTDTTSFPAATGKRGVLNPAFSLWLMGYPAVWLWCAPANNPQPRTKKAKKSAGLTASVPSEVPATPSSRKTRRSSSRRSSKSKGVK